MCGCASEQFCKFLFDFEFGQIRVEITWARVCAFGVCNFRIRLAVTLTFLLFDVHVSTFGARKEGKEEGRERKEVHQTHSHSFLEYN